MKVQIYPYIRWKIAASTSFDNLTNLEKSKLYDGFIYGYIIYDNA